MRVTLIGHATMLIEMEGCTVLMDPVFGDPFEDGAVVACPSRKVFVDRLPKLDKVIISHSHLDHFDIPSLAQLPRDVEVLCPEDPTIPYVLEKLGFTKVRSLEAGALVEFGKCSIFTTFSNIDVIEFGVIFKDPSGVFWNEVDTVITPSAIEYARMQMGEVDLLFSVYASQNLGFFGSMRAGYPLDLPARNLSNVLQIQPKLVVPGSAGFRFAGLLEWTNPFVFPISRDHFFDDMKRVAPNIPAALANPGDVFEIADGKVTRHPASSPIATMTEDDTHLIEFDATASVPPLTDPNPMGYSVETIEREVETCFRGLEDFVRSAYSGPKDGLVEELRRTASTFGLGVVFPSNEERWLHFAFDAAEPKITRAKQPLRDANVTHRIAASILAARLRYEKSYCYYRGFSRLADRHVGTAGEANRVRVEKDPPDLLGYYLHHRAPHASYGATMRLDFQLKTYFERVARGAQDANAHLPL
jgi:hypothetical protein